MSATSTLDTYPSKSPTNELAPRLLIIDDEAAACELIGRVAEKIGFVATSAGCLEDASELLRTGCYDCITLDLFLGKSSAVALFRTLVDTAPTTPIIIITGAPDWSRHSAVSLGKAARLNVVASITKPIDFGDLREILGSLKEYKPTAASGR